jgi:hypothetical protein
MIVDNDVHDSFKGYIAAKIKKYKELTQASTALVHSNNATGLPVINSPHAAAAAAAAAGVNIHATPSSSNPSTPYLTKQQLNIDDFVKHNLLTGMKRTITNPGAKDSTINYKITDTNNKNILDANLNPKTGTSLINIHDRDPESLKQFADELIKLSNYAASLGSDNKTAVDVQINGFNKKEVEIILTHIEDKKVQLALNVTVKGIKLDQNISTKLANINQENSPRLETKPSVH